MERSLGNDLELKLEFGGCSELLIMAERELTAFYGAVKKLFGREAAEASAKEWMESIAGRKRLPSSTREWREITYAVMQRLAERVELCATET